MSGVFVFLIAGECVYVIYKSWQTKMVAQKTGVCMHRLANAANENYLYEIVSAPVHVQPSSVHKALTNFEYFIVCRFEWTQVNHLSLKLLNHQVDFNACGFFDMDMTTVYAVRQHMK